MYVFFFFVNGCVVNTSPPPHLCSVHSLSLLQGVAQASTFEEHGGRYALIRTASLGSQGKDIIASELKSSPPPDQSC